MKKLRKESLLGLGFMSPSLIIVSIIFAFPLFYSFRTSFFRLNLMRPGRTAFIGLANYFKAFVDERFIRSLGVTLVYVVVSVSIGMVLGLLVSVIMNRQKYGKPFIKGLNTIRMILLLPAIIAPVAAGSVFRATFFHYDYGLFNYLLELLRIPKVGWLFAPVPALIAVILLEIWIRTPYSILVFDAAIRGLPPEQFEAARLEGASTLQQVLYLTLPAIKPQVLFTLVLQMTLTFRQFDTVFMLTGGGPGDSTRLMTLYIYNQAFGRLSFGYGNALSVIMLIIVGVIVLGSVKFLGQTEEVSWSK